MPIFEFECGACNHRFEQLMRASDRTPTCPQCGGRKAEKLFSSFGCKTEGGFSSGGRSGSCSGCSSHNCSSCK